MSAVDSDPDFGERLSQAVAAGEAVADRRDAAAAAEFARVVQARLRGSMWKTGLRISVGFLLVWLLLIVLPVSLALRTVYWRVLAAGVVLAWLVLVLTLLMGWRQLRLAERAERRNEAIARAAGPPPDA